MRVLDLFISKKKKNAARNLDIKKIEYLSVEELRSKAEPVKNEYLIARQRFLTIHNNFHNSVNSEMGSWNNFLESLYDGLKKGFGHEDLVKYVFESPEYFGVTLKMFEQMETSLKFPTKTNYRLFDETKILGNRFSDKSYDNKYPVEKNLILSRRLNRLRGPKFYKALATASNANNYYHNFEMLFNGYNAVSELEYKYFKILCEIRDKKVHDAQVSISK